MFPVGNGELVSHIQKVKVGEDEFGEPEHSDTQTEYFNVVVAGRTPVPNSEENTDSWNRLEEGFTLHFTEEPFPDVSPEDAFLIRGKRYESSGAGFLWRDPFTGEVFGYSANAKRMEG